MKWRSEMALRIGLPRATRRTVLHAGWSLLPPLLIEDTKECVLCGALGPELVYRWHKRRQLFEHLYGAKEIEGRWLIQSSVRVAYELVRAMANFQREHGSVTFAKVDAVVAANQAHLDPHFTGAVQTALSLVGRKAVRELIDARRTVIHGWR